MAYYRIQAYDPVSRCYICQRYVLIAKYIPINVHWYIWYIGTCVLIVPHKKNIMFENTILIVMQNLRIAE